MNIETVAKSIYGFFGTLFLLTGVTVMFLHTGLLPEAIERIVLEFAHGDPNEMHLIQEFSSLLVFAGLITFWFIRHYQQSKHYHWAMTVFWALFAIAHWFDGSATPRSNSGALANTIPFLLFLLIGLLRFNSDRQLAGVASK